MRKWTKEIETKNGTQTITGFSYDKDEIPAAIANLIAECRARYEANKQALAECGAVLAKSVKLPEHKVFKVAFNNFGGINVTLADRDAKKAKKAGDGSTLESFTREVLAS